MNKLFPVGRDEARLSCCTVVLIFDCADLLLVTLHG